MDTQKAINSVDSLISQRKNEIDALQFAKDILTNGFQVDNARIEATVNAEKELLAKTIEDLTNRATTAETEVSDMKTVVEQLTTRAETAEAALANTPEVPTDTTASDTPATIDTTSSDTPATVDTTGTATGEGIYETDNMGNAVLKK